jgi:hypothetical protein
VQNLWEKSLRTGSQILSDLANKPADVSARDILTEHVTAKAQNLAKKGGKGSRNRKRKTRKAADKKKKK